MRREFIQVIAVIAIALGAGLFAFGRHVDPPLDPTNQAAIQRAMELDKELRIAASCATGIGVCFMTFGILSVLIPWANDALAARRDRADTKAV
jgi:hypothetical protein